MPGTVVNSFTTIELGVDMVKLLGIRSLPADKWTRPLGVMRHEQQAISCSSGENAYTLTHTLPVVPAVAPK